MFAPTMQGNWVLSSGWRFAGEELCFFPGVQKSMDSDSQLAICDHPIPANCDLTFQWRVSGDAPGQADPGFVFQRDIRRDMDHAYGASVEYLIAGTVIRLHCNDVTTALPYEHEASWFVTSGPPKNYSLKPGEWNKSRIVICGHKVLFLLNGSLVFDLDLDSAAKQLKAQGEQDRAVPRDIVGRELGPWLSRPKDRLYLTIETHPSEPQADPRLCLRSLKVKECQPGLLLELAGKKDTWDWESNFIFKSLPFSQTDSEAIGAKPASPDQFEPVAALKAPGGTNDPEVINSYLSSHLAELALDKELAGSVRELYADMFVKNVLHPVDAKSYQLAAGETVISSVPFVTVWAFTMSDVDRARQLESHLISRAQTAVASSKSWRVDTTVVFVEDSSSDAVFFQNVCNVVNRKLAKQQKPPGSTDAE